MPAHISEGNFFAGKTPVYFAYEFGDDTEATDFTATAITSGTIAVQQARGGTLRVSGAATTDASGHQIQHEKTPFKAAKGDWLEVVGSINTSILNYQWIFGVAVLDTSLIASAPTDGIYLVKAEDAETMSLVVRASSTAIVSPSLGAIHTSGTAQVWGFRVEYSSNDVTKGVVIVFLNGTQIYKTDEITLPTAAMGLSFAGQSGSASGTQYADLDFIAYRFKR